jgi:beta-glucosidase
MMLKYENIVSRLDESSKIELLTNLRGLTEKELVGMGLHTINVGKITEITKNIYPTPEMLACSWNEQLAYKVGKASAELCSARGIAFAFAPAARIKLDPYSDAISEDGCLSASISGAYASGAKESGMAVCVSDMGVSRDETKWLGDPPDHRVLYDYVARPYIEAARAQKDAIVGIREDMRIDRYSELNSDLVRIVRSSGKQIRFVCENASATNTVKMINNQVVCLQGAGYALQAALRKYENIKRAVDRGELEENELMEQIKCGGAISPDMLDAAVDRLIDMIESCEPEFVSEESASRDEQALAYKAALESAVLLKNDGNLLPIAKKKKIAIVGDIITREDGGYLDALSKKLEENGAKVMGYARGYELCRDDADANLMNEALALAGKADVALLFVGTDAYRESYIRSTKNLSLPANQDMLAQKLSESGVKTVALLCSNYSVDIAAVEQLAAVMLTQNISARSAEACADLLMGIASPSGKLAATLYRNTDRVFERRKQQLGEQISVGRFIGYRYYDSADYDVGFPFGHGLSYSRFSYSALRVEENGKLSLSVRNTGKLPAAEVVQIYAGYEDRDYLRPKKELIAFKKVFLDVGESATLSFDVKLPRVYDDKTGELVVQKGKYTIYAGSSLTDIKQMTKITSEGVEFEKSDETLARYLLSESNIITDNYTLEARYPIMKRAIKNIFCGVALLLVAIFLQVYCVSTNTASAFLNILTVAILGIAIAFFILDAIDRKRMNDKEREIAKEENQKWFEDATHLESFSTDKMFAEDFNEPDQEIDQEDEPVMVSDVADEYLAYVDKELTFDVIVREFAEFALERGCKLDINTVYNLFGAISSSRFVILNGLEKQEFASLAGVLCEYLECNFHMDTADKSYTDGASMFIRTDDSGNKVKTGALRTVEEANASLGELHVAPIAQVSIETMEKCFGDIVKYAKAPELPSLVSSIEEKYRFSRNILFLVGLDSQRTLGELPENVAEVATVCDIKLTLSDRATTFKAFRKLKLYQLEYMADKAAAEVPIDEAEWKKLDAFERYVGYRTGYVIGNKRWISLERYVAVYVSAGGDSTDALDKAIVSRLLPSVVCACKNASNASEINLGEAIDSIFGDSSVDASRRAIRNARINAKDQGEANV